MAKWIVSGSAEKFERFQTRTHSGSIQVRATHLNVEVTATTAGYAHDKVVEALEASGWRDIKLTGINEEV